MEQHGDFQKGRAPFGRLNEGSPEGGELSCGQRDFLSHLPGCAGEMGYIREFGIFPLWHVFAYFLHEQKVRPPAGLSAFIESCCLSKHNPSTALEGGSRPLQAGEVFAGRRGRRPLRQPGTVAHAVRRYPAWVLVGGRTLCAPTEGGRGGLGSGRPTQP